MSGLKRRRKRKAERLRGSYDGHAIAAAQSLRGASIAAIGSVVLLNAIWMISASALDKVLPWYVIVQGALTGLAVRRFGKGLNWRFPLVAALAAWIGAYTGNFMLAADTAADELGVGPLRIIASISEWTLGTYFQEVVGAAEHIFALCAAAIAAFFAERQLNRDDVFAFRSYKQDEPG